MADRLFGRRRPPCPLRRIADLAIRNRMPSIGFTGYAESGGLLDYGVNFFELWRRSMTYVDKILKGAKPVDPPGAPCPRMIAPATLSFRGWNSCDPSPTRKEYSR